MSFTEEPPPNIDSARCASRQALALIGGKWVVLVVRGLRAGPMRSTELRRRINGVSQRMFTRTLREMERNGLVTRAVEPTVPPRVTYDLTGLGRSLLAPLAALTDWAEHHLPEVHAAQERHGATPDGVTANR